MCFLQYSDAFANLSNIPLSFCAAIAVAKKIPKEVVFKKLYNNLIPSMFSWCRQALLVSVSVFLFGFVSDTICIFVKLKKNINK